MSRHIHVHVHVSSITTIFIYMCTSTCSVEKVIIRRSCKCVYMCICSVITSCYSLTSLVPRPLRGEGRLFHPRNGLGTRLLFHSCWVWTGRGVPGKSIYRPKMCSICTCVDHYVWVSYGMAMMLLWMYRYMYGWDASVCVCVCGACYIICMWL